MKFLIMLLWINPLKEYKCVFKHLFETTYNVFVVYVHEMYFIYSKMNIMVFLQICTYNLSKKQNYKEIYFMNDYFYDYKKVIFEVLWIIFEKLIRFWIWRCREEREWVVFMWKRLLCPICSANNMLAHIVACYSIIQLWLLDNLNLKFKHEWFMALLT